MVKTQAEERTYTPAEVCRLFNLNRTTLFRWEDEGKIPPAERDLNNQRIYYHSHLMEIRPLIRKRIGKTLTNVFQNRSDEASLYCKETEQLARIDVVCGPEPPHGIKQLRALLIRNGPLPEDTIDFLIEAAKLHPPGDVMRQQIWQLLDEHEKVVEKETKKDEKVVA